MEIDKGACSYPAPWNAFMRADEKRALFQGRGRRGLSHRMGGRRRKKDCANSRGAGVSLHSLCTPQTRFYLALPNKGGL
jgi:hypothetical protein